MSDLVGNPEDRFSRVAALMIAMGNSNHHRRAKSSHLQLFAYNSSF